MNHLEKARILQHSNKREKWAVKCRFRGFPQFNVLYYHYYKHLYIEELEDIDTGYCGQPSHTASVVWRF